MEEDSYEEIREEVKAEPSVHQEISPGSQEEAVARIEPEPHAALEAKPQTPEDAALEAKPQKPKEKPPRMTCDGCGRSYSVRTKRHNCKAPKGFERKENIPPPAPPPDLPPLPGPAERQITLDDVNQFLFGEAKARREQRRDSLLSKMF